MSTATAPAPEPKESAPVEREEPAPLTVENETAPISAVASQAEGLAIDQLCVDKEVGDVPADNYKYTESDQRDEAIQTRKDSGNNPERPNSLDKMEGAPNLLEPLNPCPDNVEDPVQACRNDSRNPITGLGLNGDGVGGLKPKKLKIREGNPVTGEGYKAGGTDYQHRQDTSHGGTPMINKNRVPPGGYSSGLW
ncbi:microtubule-associated protein Jupiter isoform X4 [Drosophila serrata]|uniref:microtubule-associated protein Jupiter isoform X4 n=1 Tax=Drosophila serrata TaxID=7274 RepID=UPI000A1D3093|nr:microtubule-associated protein Jupiter isoform X4 [Drosophila serrata]